MSIDNMIAILIFLVVQAVLFGAGAIVVLASPLSDGAVDSLPWVIGLSVLIAIPLARRLAPRLRVRFEMLLDAPGN